MIVVPIARDRVLLVAMVLCWALAASCGLYTRVAVLLAR